MTICLRLSILFVISLGLLRAEELSPEVQKYLKACDEAVAKFEKEHPAEVQACGERLKKIHGALYRYLLDHKGIWPQPPKELFASTDRLHDWWKELLGHYGVTAAEWEAKPKLGITFFDDKPLTAYQWRGQPWVMAFSTPDWPSYIIVADGSIVGNGFNLVPAPRLSGQHAFDTGGSKPAMVPDEMKKAAGVK